MYDTGLNSVQSLRPDMHARLLAMHLEKVKKFFNDLAGLPDDYVSHTTCFCCLVRMPEHVLPCGHVLCGRCVKAYGKTADKSRFKLEFCPMHREDTLWDQPHWIRVKPKYAGVRVLALDGYVLFQNQEMRF